MTNAKIERVRYKLVFTKQIFRFSLPVQHRSGAALFTVATLSTFGCDLRQLRLRLR